MGALEKRFQNFMEILILFLYSNIFPLAFWSTGAAIRWCNVNFNLQHVF